MRELKGREKRRTQRSDSLATYLREISAYPLLTRDVEAELARRIGQGDHEALNQLVCANLRFVVSVAKRYSHFGVPLIDLIAEGNIGLLRAARRIDARQDGRFISYAVWWIRQGIVQALANHSHTMRVPIGRESMIRRLGRRANDLRQSLQREPTRKELAAAVGLTEQEVEIAIPAALPSLSLDTPVHPGGAVMLLDVMGEETPEESLGLYEDRARHLLKAALEHLSDRERTVLTMYFGLDDGRASTLEGVAEMMGITRERVRQIKERAFRRLRAMSEMQALHPERQTSTRRSLSHREPSWQRAEVHRAWSTEHRVGER